jgi:alanine-glyoxylate transaminase/serine-glyoxylate transaminase/serine-pyruvate transaminase
MTVHTGRHFLQIPGPTNIPDRVLRAMDMPSMDHRSAEFAELGFAVLAAMQRMFRTRQPVIIYPSSGTGAWEAAIVNVLSPGDKVLMAETGQFAVLWLGIAEKFKLDVDFIPGDWRRGADVAQIEARLAADRQHQIKAVMVVHNETSTGCVTHPLEVRKAMDRAKHPALLMVDTISGLGSQEYEHDAWGIDVSVGGSQKALMLPPGLAFVSVSPKAWDLIDRNPTRRTFYFDLKKAKTNLEAGETPYTPAHTLLRALKVSLKKIRAEGIENVWKTQARNAAAARAGFQAMGLELFAARPADGLTVAKVPDGIDGSALLSKLEKQYGLKLAGGQDNLKGKIIRLAHMGYIDQFDVLAALAGVELVLKEMGHPGEPGKGVAAAQQVWAKALSAK